MITPHNYNTYFLQKTINDPIYGSIGFSRIEIELLDTRAMQRLRRIKQMGFSSYVFPGGEHSRFIHSIGVMYVMGRMCDHLYRQGYSNFSEKDVEILRIAALLHDVGHYPFSHLTEYVFSYIDSEPMLHAAAVDTSSSSLISKIANHKKREEVNHEHLGAEIILKDIEIRSILDKNGIDPELVGRIITGEIGSEKMVYSQLMHSDLDADRLDYLVRDSSQAGVVFGIVDLNYIIQRLVIAQWPRDKEQDPTINILAVDYRGQHTVEHFLMSRYFHYIQTVFHRTATAFEAIVKYLIYKTLKNSRYPYQSYNDIINGINTSDFYNFYDDSLWMEIVNYISSSGDDIDKLMWKTISERKKPRRIIFKNDIVPKRSGIIDSRPVNDSNYFLYSWVIERQQKEIAQATGLDIERLCYISSVVSIESVPSYIKMDDCKDIHDFPEELVEAIKIYHNNKKVKFLASDPSSLINKMVDYTANSLSIFVIDPDKELDTEKIKETIQQMCS